MKRFPELRDLSDDHHHGLALAQRAKRAASGEGPLTVDEVWAEILLRFPQELEPHFQAEEEALAPLMEKHGERALIDRLREEHGVLRACVAPEAGRAPEDLERFGELLTGHIRFEEQELFEKAQEELSREELETVQRTRREKGVEH